MARFSLALATIFIPLSSRNQISLYLISYHCETLKSSRNRNGLQQCLANSAMPRTIKGCPRTPSTPSSHFHNSHCHPLLLVVTICVWISLAEALFFVDSTAVVAPSPQSIALLASPFHVLPRVPLNIVGESPELHLH